MDLGLDNKIVLITGSTKGIGRGIAEAFLKEGAKVFLSGRKKTILNHELSILQNNYGDKNVYGFSGDLIDQKVVVCLADYIS